jgi:hypothetical protein
MELAYGNGEVFNWEKQRRVLEKSLRECKQVFDHLAPELRVWPAGGQFGQAQQPYYLPVPEFAEMRGFGVPNNQFDIENNPDERRRVQYEIQKANIYASYLSTRSFIVEKYFSLSELNNKIKSQQNSPEMSSAGLDTVLQGQASTAESEQLDQEMADEREQIIKDLLIVLGSIQQVNMEPNGDSFVSHALSPFHNPSTLTHH